ncbi:aquaporin AQPAe.a isoform X2 [Agrilus planipennis]|uniref:Aquaporin AQPAe.a isoform X2 n=1 Tax=Agrilus planipennis TaxID=224129 RepID=A0A7F5QXH8_AGRPL|nr:aquaporin AQPAe.a isoform X2 [Agrilus planipennis]
MAKDKLFVLTDNLSIYDRTVLCASEFLGTAILVYVGCMGCVTFGNAPNHLAVSICFGCGVMLAIQCVAHISGAHINPVVTIASAILGNLPLIEVPVYFVGQFIGAIAGFGALKATTPSEFIKVFINNTEPVPGICSPVVSPNVSSFHGFLSEFFATLILILLCCSVWDPRNSTKHDSVPIKFGLAIVALALSAGPYSGAHLNPARSLAPALWNGDWKDHWVYWLGPTLAAIFGAATYRFFFSFQQDEKPNSIAETIPLNDKP